MLAARAEKRGGYRLTDGDLTETDGAMAALGTFRSVWHG
jgi:hypothetical protein